MNQHTVQGLRNVIRAIEQTEDDGWNMRYWWDSNNRYGCAIGNYVQCGLSRVLYFRPQEDPERRQFSEVCANDCGVVITDYDAIGFDLGLTRDECIRLFSQFSYDAEDPGLITKDQVIENLNDYIGLLERSIQLEAVG